ncbi:MAG: hypothetical protein RI897_1435 [Verrucomicrobiota bacterium]
MEEHEPTGLEALLLHGDEEFGPGWCEWVGRVVTDGGLEFCRFGECESVFMDEAAD